MGWNALPTFTVTWFPSVSMTGTCFSAAPSEVLGSNISKGFKLSGSAALGAPEMASRMTLWFLSVKNTGSFFMGILQSRILRFYLILKMGIIAGTDVKLLHFI